MNATQDKDGGCGGQGVTSAIFSQLLEQFLRGQVTPAQLESIFQQFKKSVLQRALGAEMSHPLATRLAKSSLKGAAANHRNGKTILTDVGALSIDVPCDREGSFELQLIGKQERRVTRFDDLNLRL